MAPMKNLRSLSTVLLALIVLPSCRVQPRPAPNTASSETRTKKALPLERWQVVGGGMLGTASDTKGSKMSWRLDDGPKRGQKALLLEYQLKPGGWCGAWHTTENVNLGKSNGIKFMARAEPPGTVQFSMTDANKVSYVAAFQTSKEWKEVRIPLAALDKNANFQPPDSVQGKPADWSRVQSMNFDARSEGDGKIWIGPVQTDDGE